MEAPEYKRVVLPMDSVFMWNAEKESHFSTDLRRPIGCVIVNAGDIVGHGSNQATVRWAPLQRFHVKHCVRKLLGIKRHAFYWLCPGCALFRNHAEVRAINTVHRLSNVSAPVDMYLWGHSFCCDRCLDAAKRLGVRHIYTHEN